MPDDAVCILCASQSRLQPPYCESQRILLPPYCESQRILLPPYCESQSILLDNRREEWRKMILVDIYIPALDAVYDFMLDENADIGLVREEIHEILLEKVQESGEGISGMFTLWSADTKRLLQAGSTLHASGVTDGCRLIYV